MYKSTFVLYYEMLYMKYIHTTKHMPSEQQSCLLMHGRLSLILRECLISIEKGIDPLFHLVMT